MFTSSEYIISILFYGFPWFTFSLLLSSNEYLLFSLKSFGTLFSSYLIIQIFCIPFIFLTKENFKQELKYLSLFIALPIITLMITNFNKEENNFKIKTINLEIFQLNFKNNDKFLTSEKKLQRIIKHIDESLIIWRSTSQWIGGLYFLFSIILLIDIFDENFKKSFLLYLL